MVILEPKEGEDDLTRAIRVSDNYRHLLYAAIGYMNVLNKEIQLLADVPYNNLFVQEKIKELNDAVRTINENISS